MKADPIRHSPASCVASGDFWWKQCNKRDGLVGQSRLVNLKMGQVHILPRQLPVGESMLTFRLQYLADLLALLQLRVFTQLHHDNRSIAG